MKIVTYNTHYAIGKDNCYDLERVVEAIRGADIIALQEVERHYGVPDGPRQPEDIGALLPDYYWVFDAAFDIDGSEAGTDGKILNRRRQHGQMLLSRWPILSKRYYPLPRIRIDDDFNMQMGVLEAVLDTPGGALRVYNAHFGSVSSEERQRQSKMLVELVRDAPTQGGAWTGPADSNADRDWSAGMPQPPMPSQAVVLGDFNMAAESPEYQVIVTATTGQDQPLLTDIWAGIGDRALTWHPNPGRPGFEASASLDYCFLTHELVARAGDSWVDEAAQGSDHQPVWLELANA